MKDEGLENEMSSYLKKVKANKANGLKQMNREQSQWDVTSNSIPIIGASVPLSQAQDHNVLCRFAIITNEFISTNKTVHWCEENLLLPLVREAGYNLI